MSTTPKYEIDQLVWNTRRKSAPKRTQRYIEIDPISTLCVQYNGYLQTFYNVGQIKDAYFTMFDDYPQNLSVVFAHDGSLPYTEVFNTELIVSAYYWDQNDQVVYLFKDQEVNFAVCRD